MLVAIFAIAISNVIPESLNFDEIVEVEELEDLGSHLDSDSYQSDILSTGSGSGGSAINSSFGGVIIERKAVFTSSILHTDVSTGTSSLKSVPLFIRYCSLIVYS